MGEKTGIAWTDHTFNPWIGCTRESAGCVNCYAERENKRFNWIPKWGKGMPRRRTTPKNWDSVREWEKKALKDKVVRRIFCGSLCDILDNEIDTEWRTDLWLLADDTSKGLEWLFLTKREKNIASMFPAVWLAGKNPNIRIGVTAENQEMYDKRMPYLATWPVHNFISVEPMLGEVNLHLEGSLHKRIPDWVIVGAESGPNARPMQEDWVRSVRDQCYLVGVPFFYKQSNFCGNLIHTPELDGKQWLEFPKI